MVDGSGATTVAVRLFGALREHVDPASDALQVPWRDGDTPRALLERLLERAPSLAELIDPEDAGRTYALALDRAYVDPLVPCETAPAELAIIPPVSGG